jgi:metallo-beta-lactamase class B
MNRFRTALTALLLFLGIALPGQTTTVFESASLRIDSLTPHTYVHVSYLFAKGYGKVACNGLIYLREGEAAVVDSPASDTVATELLDWITDQRGARTVAVVATHFHDDCLGGLAAFHRRGIPSYGQRWTRELAAAIGLTPPRHTFSDELSLGIGDGEMICAYPGPGHTVDNIVCYLPEEEVLFGGCLIKAEGAGKGNLADADVKSWPGSVVGLHNQGWDIRYVVPGHGVVGDAGLLDYTVRLFE